MEHCKIIAVGDNVCDKYLSRGKMYPGGQCVNTCVYVKINENAGYYVVIRSVESTEGEDEDEIRRY